MEDPTPEVRLGRYQHYKGRYYEVLGVAKHSESEEEFVVYRPLYGAGDWWIRPKKMFLEQVIAGGATMPRFHHVDNG